MKLRTSTGIALGMTLVLSMFAVVDNALGQTPSIMVDKDGLLGTGRCNAVYSEVRTAIQDAINVVDDGGTVIVCAALYEENITIGKNVKLLGNAGAIIDGSANSNVPVISVNGFLANSVEINGFEIRNGLNGIEVSSLSPSGGCTNFDTNGIIIGNNYIHDNASGILFDNTCLGRVHDNKIHNNKIGVELGNNSDTNYFIHNDIFKSGAEGILVSDSASNGNTFHHNFLRQNTAWGIDAFDGNILKENIANKNGAGGYRLMNSNIVTDNQAKNSGTMPSPANGYSIEGSGNKLTGNLGKKNTGDGFFAAMTSSGNTFTSNRGIENGSFGFNDDSTGAGTAGTNNTYVKNRCRDNVVGGSQPSGLCIPQP